jgi:outer membrane lipase/esterase
MAASVLVDIGQVGAMPVATISALRQQSVGLEQRLNLGAFFINDDAGNRIRRPVGNVEVYGGFEAGFYSSDAQQVVPGFDAATQVAKVAADVMVTDNVMVGAGVSIDHGQVDFADNRGGFDSRLFVGGVFGVAQVVPGVYVNGFLGGGLIDIYDIDRSFSAGPARESYEADTDGTYFIARTNVGAVLPLGNGFAVNPSIGFAFERVDIDGYTEQAQGGSAPGLQATFGDLEYEGHRGTVALAGFYRPPSDPTWTFGLRGSWEHDFNDDDVAVPVGVGSAPINVQNAPRPDDSYGLLTATIVKELSHSTSLSFQGTTNVFQNGVDGYTGSLVLKHTF